MSGIKKSFLYIYGPVFSWRLGRSLGIDPLSCRAKACNFDCVYCQLGDRRPSLTERSEYVSTSHIIREIKSLPPIQVDYITFSGTGEPTLASNLGEMIKAVKSLRKEKIAVITNSSLLGSENVRKDLSLADFVIAKLDAPSEVVFAGINRPAESLRFDTVIYGIKGFRAQYKNRFALQIMFTENNRAYAKEIADIAGEIGPDEVQINTPLRDCAAAALSRPAMDAIKVYFKGMKIVSIYDVKREYVKPINKNDTLSRREIN